MDLFSCFHVFVDFLFAIPSPFLALKMQTKAFIVSILSSSIGINKVNAFDCTEAAFAAVLPSNATVNFAVNVPQNGSFGGAPDDLEFPVNATNLPSLCAVSINVISSNVSSFNFGLFLPDDWNSRTMTAGNGGFGGGINWPDMGIFSHYGFAAIATDTGHISAVPDLSWALNKPETIVDWAYRAMHFSVVMGKQLVDAYYGHTIQHSYYASCSTGGRQGLKEIQMFPEDFDGVVIGAPAWWTTHLALWTLKVGLINLPANAPNHIPASLFPTVVDEITRQCDGQDGVVDGIIMDPYSCNFYPDALLCTSAGNNSDCLTPAQLDTLYYVYSDYVDVNQTFVFPGFALGADPTMAVGVSDAPLSLGTGYVQNFIVNDSNWDYRNYDYSIVQLTDKLDPGNATADSFDLSAFNARGGKMLQYHGLADELISTGSTIYFYNHVLQTMAPKGVSLDDFYRFFLVPGMGHCSGSAVAPWYFAAGEQQLNGTTHSVPGFENAQHDVILAVMAWVENGTAPDQIVATKFANDTAASGVQSQRPLCVYPKQAKYVGEGNVDEASSWECRSLY